MGLSEERIDQLTAAAERFLAGGGTRSGLERAARDEAPDIRVAVCSEDDVVHEPVRERAAFDVHLIGGEHCLSITGDPERAVGVVFAMREDPS